MRLSAMMIISRINEKLSYAQRGMHRWGVNRQDVSLAELIAIDYYWKAGRIRILAKHRIQTQIQISLNLSDYEGIDMYKKALGILEHGSFLRR